MNRVYSNNMRGFELQTSATIDQLHIHSAQVDASGIENDGVSITADNTLMTGINPQAAPKGTVVLTFKDPVEPITTILNQSAGSDTLVQYTCNIHVVDEDGANLSGVTVICDISASSNYDTEEFSVVTAGDGTITEQTIDAKLWEGTGETLTDYAPMRFTFSKSGYENLVMENITVDDPIDWRIELQTQNKLFGATDIVKVCGVG